MPSGASIWRIAVMKTAESNSQCLTLVPVDLEHLPECLHCGFIYLQGNHNMKKSIASRSQQPRRPKADVGRPTIGIRELKAKASAIIDDVKSRRVCYAVTKRGTVEALIVPVDAGERLLGQADVDSGWDAWQMLVEQLTKESGKRTRSAAAELDQMRR
jgi:antitoxin (DNA-binding transcriptional repressor) of toxin-antitoxin stability system